MFSEALLEGDMGHQIGVCLSSIKRERVGADWTTIAVKRST